MIDRLSGEILPDPYDFHYLEVAAFAEKGFIRNVTVATSYEIKTWRARYGNTGIFRSLLLSNTTNFLDQYKNKDTLFYGDFCFDFDVSKTEELEEEWPKLIASIERDLLPRLSSELQISTESIQLWFSGSRGMHVVVPARALGIWPDHDLHRVLAHYANKLKKDLNLKYLDMSLYGNKHLFRMENSIHQKTNLYKFPVRASELRAIKDYANLKKIAVKPRSYQDLWKTIEPSTKAQVQYDKMYAQALAIPTPKIMQAKPNNLQYNRNNWHCISTLFSDDFLLERGVHRNTAFLVASHLHQEGFSFEEAEKEMNKWATHHCDPPLSPSEWLDTLNREYRSETIELPAGCAYVQRLIPHLCKEDICPIGIAVAKNRARRQSQK